MATFAERLRKLRKKVGFSQRKLADMVDVSPSTINSYEHGARNPQKETIEAFADIFNVDVDYLLGRSDQPNQFILNVDKMDFETTYQVPLLGNIACGEPIWANQEQGTYFSISKKIKADFCLRAKGESMINARIMDGDIVFIRRQPMVENGEIAAVIIDNEATLKRAYYNKSENRLVLNPENPAFIPLVYQGRELENIRILGKAIAFQSVIK